MQGQSFVLEFYSIKNNQNQSLSTVTAGGMLVQKSVFNKYQGYNEVNGQRIPLTDSELENAIIDSALFSELNYDFSFILPPWEEIYTNDLERYESFEECERINQNLIKTYKENKINLIEVPKFSVKERVNFINEFLSNE